MNYFFTMVIVAVTFALGIVVGEAFAPISGTTLYALQGRVLTLEQKVEILEPGRSRARRDMSSYFAAVAL